MESVLARIYLRTGQKSYVTYSFNWGIEIEGLLKIAWSHVSWIADYISKTVHERDVFSMKH